MTTRLRYALLAAAAFASATLSAGLVDDWGFTPRTHTSWSSYWDGNQRVYEETVVATDNWTYASGVLSGTIMSNDYSYWSSRCELATPPGRGWVSLKWRVVNADDESQAIRAYGYSYGNGSDGGELYVYNTSGDYGSAGYQSALIPVRSSDGGTVEIRFSRDSDSPNLKLLVTDITWTPDTSPVTISFSLTGGRFRNGTTTATLTRTDVYGSLPEPVRDNCTFLGWSENARSYNDNDDIVCEDTPLPMETNVTLYATWDIPVEEALDPTGALRDESRGNWIDVFGDFCVLPMWDWRYETNETGCVIGEEVYAGECAELMVGNDGSDEIDLLTLNVHGCGYLDFGKRNAYYGGCYGNWGADLVLLIDGEEVDVLTSGSSKRFEGVYEIRSLAGLRAKEDGLTASDPAYDLHEVRLVARPDEEHSDMSQFSFMILPIRWTEVSGRQTVTFDARGGASVTSRSYAVGAAYGSLPTPTRAGATFLGWFTEPDGGEQVVASELLRPSVTTLYARWAAPLTTALGGELTVTSKNGTWCGAADVSRQNDGSWSASVDDAFANLLNGTTCVMSTTVQGRGIVSFWWMEGKSPARSDWVDPEDLGVIFYDSLTPLLSLWVDGKMVAEYEKIRTAELLSPNSQWKHLSYAIAGDGVHTVEWRYGAAYLMGREWKEAWFEEYIEETNEWIEEMRKLSGRSYVERVYPPGAWVQDVSWRPEGEVNDLVTWARAAVEGGTWLTDELASIESFYAKKIKSEPKNYEWRVLRALTTLAKLGEDDSLLAVLKKFGFVPDYQNLGTFTGSLTYSRAPLSNAVVDSVAQSALPALNAALADLEAIPDTWTGSVALSPNAYPVDETTYVDLADVTFARAAVKGALATLAIAQGYDLTLVYAKLDSRIKAHDNNGKLPTVKEVIADHPSFLKSVRNKTRLAEGKTLFRSALELAQAADRRILARTSDELHFLEYDEADADELQFARDEVAKALASLDATVVLTDDDFARAKNYRLQGVNQRATLKPFFAGAVTRSLLPTKYDTKGIPLVSSLPDATFGGILPGLTAAQIESWQAENALEIDADGTLTRVYGPMSASLTLPDRVTAIAAYAFDGCDGLTSVTVPEDVAEIDAEAFLGCPGLKTIVLMSDADYSFETPEGCVVLVKPTLAVDEVEPYYAVGAELYVGIVTAPGSKLQVTGLPRGLTFGQEGAYGWIEGAPTAAGVSKVTVTSTSGAMSSTQQVTLAVGMLPVELAQTEGSAEMKALTGAGYYAAGRSATLRATADSGAVFAGWYWDEEGTVPCQALGVDYRTASVSLKMPTSADDCDIPIRLYARFADAWEDAACLSAGLDGETFEVDGAWEYDLEVESLTMPTVRMTGLPRGLTFDAKALKISGCPTVPGTYAVSLTLSNTSLKNKTEKFTVVVPNVTSDFIYGLGEPATPYAYTVGLAAAAADLTVTAEDGYALRVTGLPAGLTFNAKTGAVTGAPTKAGTFTVTFTATKRGAATETSTRTFVVSALSPRLVGTFNGFLAGNCAEAYVGTFTMTATALGKITARVVDAQGTYSFTGAWERDGSNGVYNAVMATRKGEVLDVTVDIGAEWWQYSDTPLGTFTRAPGTASGCGIGFSVYAEKSPLAEKWCLKATQGEPNSWNLSLVETATEADLTLTPKGNGMMTIAGKLGAYAVSGSSQISLPWISDGYLRVDFVTFVTLNGTKRPLSISCWLDPNWAGGEDSGETGSAYLVIDGD